MNVAIPHNRNDCRATHPRTVAAVSALAVMLLLSSCTPSDRFDAGHPITKDELASISAELFTALPSPGTEADDGIDTYPEGTVHWIAGGSVYHVDPDCYHLRKATDVLHGTVDEAARDGKERACSSCGEP